jgi:phosphoribosylglycinamide formyltransferase-1
VSRVRTAVLISGRGSNLSALIDAARAAEYPAEIALVISNREDAQGLSVARDAGIPVQVIPHRNYPSRDAFDAAIDAALRESNIALVCEAGFMRIHSEWFVERWAGRLLNIHPSLLPAFPGIRVHQQALDAGVKISGCTVHFIVSELDSGPIVAQAAVPVKLNDTAETLATRILEQEHAIYPTALRFLAEGKIMLKDGKCVYSHTPLWSP